MLRLVAESDPVFIQYRKTLGVDPHVSTPKKVKVKKKGNYNSRTIYERTTQEEKTDGMLIVKGKKQSSKPKSNNSKKTIDPIIIEEEEVVQTEDEETDTEVQEPIQHIFYDREGNVDDVDQMMHVTPSVSPWRNASVKSNIEETNNLDVSVNKSDVVKNITNSETPLTFVPKLNTIIRQKILLPSPI